MMVQVTRESLHTLAQKTPFSEHCTGSKATESWKQVNIPINRLAYPTRKHNSGLWITNERNEIMKKQTPRLRTSFLKHRKQ